jgi:hypothetical protein
MPPRARGSTRRGTRRVQNSPTTRHHPNGSAEIAFHVECTCSTNTDTLLDLITFLLVVTNNEGNLNGLVAPEAPGAPLAQPGSPAQVAEGLSAIEEVPHTEDLGMSLHSLFFC